MEGWLPPLIVAAGGIETWQSHCLYEVLPEVDQAMGEAEDFHINPILEKIQKLDVPNEMTRDCVDWWILALRHWIIWNKLITHIGNNHTLDGPDPDLRLQLDNQRNELQQETEKLAKDMKIFWQKAYLSDFEEYHASKFAVLNRLLDS